MESKISIDVPPYRRLCKKAYYEPLLLEVLNETSFFLNKSGGGFDSPQSQSNGECDAIGKNGNYNMDFKCLITQHGAEVINETSLQSVEILPGISVTQPSKASLRGQSSVEFQSIWGFLVENNFGLNANCEIELKDITDNSMNKTIKRINKSIKMQKNILFFHPASLFVDVPKDSITNIMCVRAKEALSILSEARSAIAPKYETYYALLFGTEKIMLLSGSFSDIGCVELSSLVSWKRLRAI